MAIKEIRREWSACQLDYVCEFMLHTEADVKDLPICCVGSVAHVSETNTDYVCNGKRWLPREGEVTVILPETALLTVEGNFFRYLMQPFSADLAEGMVCTVNYNGAEYKCTVEKLEDSGETLLVLGNVAAMKEEGNTGEPFVMMTAPTELASQGAYAQLIPFDEAESVTISITSKTELVNESENAGSAGAGAGGGGGVIYVQTFSGEKDTPTYHECFSDRALTQKMDYATGKAIILSGGWLGNPIDMEGMAYDLCLKPISMSAIDAAGAAQVVLANPNTGEDFVQYHMILIFSDTDMNL